MLWDPFLYCINDSIQGNSETGNKVFVLPSKVAINNQGGTNSLCNKYFISSFPLLDILSKSSVNVKKTATNLYGL